MTNGSAADEDAGMRTFEIPEYHFEGQKWPRAG
jgi:hypothetical protein